MNPKALTKGDLLDIEKRITEINDLLDQDLPYDVIENLEIELKNYDKILEDSIKYLERSHLKIVR